MKTTEKWRMVKCWFCDGLRKDCPICLGAGMTKERVYDKDDLPITLRETFKDDADYD